MCNNCECENQEKCSIVGYMPTGYCCHLCVYYNAENPAECLRATIKKEVFQS